MKFTLSNIYFCNTKPFDYQNVGNRMDSKEALARNYVRMCFFVA